MASCQPPLGHEQGKDIPQAQRAHQVDQEGQKADGDQHPADDGHQRVSLELSPLVEGAAQHPPRTGHTHGIGHAHRAYDPQPKVRVDQGLAAELELGEHGHQGVEYREEHHAHAGQQESMGMQCDHPLGIVKHHVQPNVGLDQAGDPAHHKAEHGAQGELEGGCHLDRAGQPHRHHRGKDGQSHGKELAPGDELSGEEPHHHRLGGITQEVVAPHSHRNQQVDHDDRLDHIGPKEPPSCQQRDEQVPHPGGVDQGVAIRHHIQAPPVPVLVEQGIHPVGVERRAE